jgi:hypothetical protein
MSPSINETRRRNSESKGGFAAIFGVSFGDLNRAHGTENERLEMRSLSKPTTELVDEILPNCGCAVVIKEFLTLPYQLFGWNADNSSSFMIRSPHCLVSLAPASQRTALRILNWPTHHIRWTHCPDKPKQREFVETRHSR